MSTLYPLKFKPILKSKIWGGKKIQTCLGKDLGKLPNCGESWEISAVQGDISIVKDGFLANNNLEEIIEIYMGDLVGDKIYEKFGIELPLLIKFIDANDDLSIQVHPDDELSKKRHNAYGKTEMWYVMSVDEGAKLNSGFNKEVSKTEYLEHIENKNLLDILNFETVKAGDVFFMPAGRVHAIGAGILLAEIQQTSDVTYRIFDYNRKDDKGQFRDLHTDLAIDAIDFTFHKNYRTEYTEQLNSTVNVIESQYFKTNILKFDTTIEKDYFHLDSFVIYICLEGRFKIVYEGEQYVNVKKGETILIPAILKNLDLIPSEESKILEVYID